MSYQYYLQHIQQLTAMGAYNVPINYMPPLYIPAVMPMQNFQRYNVDLPRNNESIIIDESDDENDIDERTLFCANLNENVTEELLYELFFQAGPLEKLHIPKNNGKRRSYGFITYKYRCTIPYALGLYQGLVLFGKRLDIKFQGKSSANGNCKR